VNKKFIAITCDNRYEAKQLCLHLREMKSRSSHERIKLHVESKIRIALETSRLYTLMLESVEEDKIYKLWRQGQRRHGVRAVSVEERHLVYFQLDRQLEDCEKDSVGNRTHAEGLLSDEDEDREEREAADVLAAD
jgi:hypothetical protein